MNVFVPGIFLFCLSLISHIIVWKIYLPKRQTKVILQIFFGVLVVGLFVFWAVPHAVLALGLYAPEGFLEYLHISLFFISLTLAYMITYSAIEVDSPSLVMVITVAKAGIDGLDKEEFEKMMTDDFLVVPRVRDLVNDKMVYTDAYGYKLTAKGFLMARLFVLYRRLLNAQKGG